MNTATVSNTSYTSGNVVNVYLTTGASGLTGRQLHMNRLGIRDERGLTLVELLVATMLGMVVSSATLAIVITSVHLSSNYSDRVDATQQGRTAMTKIAQALDSSCVASSVAPILAASDANDVWFYESLSDSPTITPNEVEISYSGGSLVMNTYANTARQLAVDVDLLLDRHLGHAAAERGAGRLARRSSSTTATAKRRAFHHAVHARPDARCHQCGHDRRGRDQLRGQADR